MATTFASTYLKFANLQMAAEAILSNFNYSTPEGLLAALKFGNNRASKFTDTLASQFISDGWVVVAHQANTGTGFSGTLFKYTGATDLSRGLVRDELVLSFRSTEFIDDAVRDSQATNDLEVLKGGWAIGQIADMEKWFAELNASPALLQGKSFSVTGYSLGGHLATAFNILHEFESQRILGTYTFNGAGVGRVNSNESLRGIVERFEQSRNDTSATFTNAAARSAYDGLRARFNGTQLQPPTAEDIAAITTLMNNGLMDSAQGALLAGALTRIKTIMDEASRISGFISSTDSPGLASVPTTQIDATKLDYQISVLLSQRSTSAVGGVVAAGVQAYVGRQDGPYLFNNMYDIYGATPPSAVSNSQLHYGRETPVFIEDQPLRRGSIVSDVVAAYGSFLEVKLLQNQFGLNDFGDTHSLVLLVDSLSVQNMLAKLDSSISSGTITSLFQAASNARVVSSSGTQGLAEGDVLESVVDAVRRLLQGPAVSPTPFSIEGGTWARIADRNVFHGNLKALTDSSAFQPKNRSYPGAASTGGSVGRPI